MSHWRLGLAGLLLVLQAGLIVRGRFVEDRYFCWAPHDRQTLYKIDVEVDGQALSHAEIEARYRIPHAGGEPRSQAHVLALIEQYEQTLGKDDAAQVLVRYRMNGGEEHRWVWPR